MASNCWWQVPVVYSGCPLIENIGTADGRGISPPYVIVPIASDLAERAGSFGNHPKFGAGVRCEHIQQCARVPDRPVCGGAIEHGFSGSDIQAAKTVVILRHQIAPTAVARTSIDPVVIVGEIYRAGHTQLLEVAETRYAWHAPGLGQCRQKHRSQNGDDG